MKEKYNVVLLITDGHGTDTGNLDWGTKEFFNLKSRFDKMNLTEDGFTLFPKTISPAASTIMSIESILYGIHAAKTHKMHWREWPKWDTLNQPNLSDFLKNEGYDVNGFSYLLNSENWLPAINCYKPELYKNFPSHKADTHSHEAVSSAVKDFFKNTFDPTNPQFLIVHSIFVFDFWKEIKDLFFANDLNYDNTIFILTADHYFPKNFGRQWLMGERDNSRILHHSDLSESNTNVPLYIKYPNSETRVINKVIAGYDILPTINDILGISNKWKGALDGHSFYPLLEGKKQNDFLIRNDNVYPYQIGERQGRITTLRFQDYKYIYKPDPASSYIAYRLDQGWEVATFKEEFYNVEIDSEELNNLIDSTEPNHQRILNEFREKLIKSNKEVLDFHVSSLLNYYDKSKLSTIIDDSPEHKILFIQTTHDEIFYTLYSVLCEKLSHSKISLFVPTSNRYLKPHNKNTQITFFEKNNDLINLVKKTNLNQFNTILTSSNLPIGDFKSVFDEAHYPVGNLNLIHTLIMQTNVKTKLCLGINLDFVKIEKVSKNLYVALKNTIKLFFINQINKYKPLLIKIIKQKIDHTSKIDPYFSSRIITNRDLKNKD
jgi:hypothetical protein